MALPKIGYPNYTINVPSSGKSIKIRPFTVKEEKVLLLASDDGDEAAIKGAVSDLIENCIVSRGVKVTDLTNFDLEYIYLKIRSVSVGSQVEFVITCKDDNETQVPYTVDLGDVEVTFPEGHEKKIMLDEEVGVIMKYPGFDTFVDIQFLNKGSDEEVLDIISDSIDQIFHGEDVYDKSTTSKKELKDFIESLTKEQFKKIYRFFETVPRLSYEFEVKNPKTGVTSQYIIEGLSSFFG